MKKEFRQDLPEHTILILMAAITFYPFIFLIITSLKDNAQFMHHFWSVTFPLHFSNYSVAWKEVGSYMLNSAIITGSTAVAVLCISTLSAYVFARYSFPGKELLFLAIISLLMIPGILTLIPLFLVVKKIGILNTRWALFFPYVAGGQIFAIFVLRSFFASLPEELFEAARIDGASETYCVIYILLPLSKPILVVIAIMNILGTWNDYIWPLVTLANDKLWTITLGLVSFESMYAGLELWGPLFAGYVIASIPLAVLFAFGMKYFVAGLTSGALKI